MLLLHCLTNARSLTTFLPHVLDLFASPSIKCFFLAPASVSPPLHDSKDFTGFKYGI